VPRKKASISGNWSRIESQNSFETDELDQSKFVLSRITSVSSIRKFFFRLKRTLILDPVKNFMFTLTMGFLSNVFVMISLIIVYERVSHSLLINLAFWKLTNVLCYYGAFDHTDGTSSSCHCSIADDFRKRTNLFWYFRLAP